MRTMSKKEVIETRAGGRIGVFSEDGSEYEKSARYELEGDKEIVALIQEKIFELEKEIAFGIGEKDE